MLNRLSILQWKINRLSILLYIIRSELLQSLAFAVSELQSLPVSLVAMSERLNFNLLDLGWIWTIEEADSESSREANNLLLFQFSIFQEFKLQIVGCFNWIPRQTSRGPVRSADDQQDLLRTN
ncbi:hypothetical protein L1987_09322 [Smallanthus sonchifolius]|uniref:Uncharacterized protein n=1 Tax=Smallanthus sonchifolius TaxID=185202 RepID=A0ACB9JPL5_9ASTR|nr:hypothetical protein L1987_09322 [Smallanthus sonchifolius]